MPLKSLQAHLSPKEAFLIEDPIDLFYLLKKPLSLGSLLIEKTHMTLFVDRRYLDACQNLPGITTMSSENKALLNYLEKSALQSVYFDSEKTSFERGTYLQEKVGLSCLAKKGLLTQQRLIKKPHEIQLIRESAHLLARIYETFLTLPKVGLSEKQIATQFKILSFEMGAEGFSFEPIIASGHHSAYAHHRPTDKIITSNEPLLIDIGITKNSYQSDMTRMVFLGSVPYELLDMHDCVLKAHQAALALCKPRTPIGHLDKAAREVFKKAGVESLFCHSLGHGLGLETHEAPRIKYDSPDSDRQLEPGMVITIEPGLYKPPLGGIRHEDLIVITETGYENFYPSYL